MTFYKLIKVNVGNDNSKTFLSSQLNLFKGDYGLDIGFELNIAAFKEKNNSTILSNFNNAYVDAVVIKPNKTKTTIKNLTVSNNIIVFKITKDLTDLVGDYYIQFSIGNTADNNDTSYFTVPGIRYSVNKPIGYIESDVEEITVLADSEGNALCDENGEYVICM